MHGGKSLSGIAHPNFKDGRHSKHLPVRLAADYQTALQDQDLLSLRAEIALTDARINELIGRLDTGESGDLWNGLRAQHDAMIAANMKARQAGEAGKAEEAQTYQRKAGQAISEIGRLIRQGHSDTQSWLELSSQLEARRRLIETERRRLVDMQMMFSVEQGMVLISAIQGILQQHITDRKQLDAIGRALAALVSEPTPLNTG